MSSTKSYDLGVVILNYNGLSYLEKFLDSIKSNTPSYATLYVIDNQSTDASRTYLQTHHSDISVITLEKNLGYAGGYNAGLEQINHEFLFLINSDLEIESGCIELLMSEITKDPMCAAVQPKVRSYLSKDYFEYAGASGGYIDNLGYPFCRGRVFETLEKDLNQYEDIVEIFWATGAAMMMRSHVFKNLEGFDEYFFAHQEEIDLCWQMKRAGYKILVIPQAVVYHVGGGTLSYDNPKKTFLNFRNNLFMIIKNESKRRLIWILPIRFILDGVAAIHFLMQGKFKQIGAIFNAHMAVYANIRIMKLKRARSRERVKSLSLNNQEKKILTGRLNRSILSDYFLLGKKKFTDIIK